MLLKKANRQTKRKKNDRVCVCVCVRVRACVFVVKFFSPQGINYNEGKGTNTEEWTKIKTKENVRRPTLAAWENSKTKESA